MSISIERYFVETSREIPKQGLETVVAAWEKIQKHDLHSEDIMLAVRSVASCFAQRPRDGCPALAFLLNAASSKPLLPAQSAVYIEAVEGILVPGADYASQFEGNEHLLRWLRGSLQGYVAQVLQQPSKTEAAFETLSFALRAFAPGQHHLTPSHSLLLQLVLASRTKIALALELLDQTSITEIDPRATGVVFSDFLAYYYYAGILYASVQRWDDAKFSFESSLTVRNYGGNAIMMAAYKAYVFVSLIADGVVRPLLNGHVEKFARTLCKEYFDVQDAFEKKNFVELNSVMENHSKVFEVDQLAPLARVCHASLLRHSIRSLTKVYVSCPLSSIAVEMGTTEDVVHGVLKEMISTGEVSAQVSSESPVTVTFFDPQTVSHRMLDESIAKCAAAENAIEESHVDVLSSVQYSSHHLRNHPKFTEIMAEFAERKQNGQPVLSKLSSFLH
ncbi:Hypothetical protein, putative [Bodo saltans]|uniref:COP9 signalosome complex subunit 3 n=1 Tax=Bodo saltans TaxID=75058 RepID=A0A0S4JPC4_BODSA|nr:Hypothetical protein, putative [Bodo saltans]|eukprot:CUG93394.1 Hypothetical protein, putative [Bodo saltans]